MPIGRNTITRLAPRLKRLGVAAACLFVISAATVATLWHAFPFPLERLESWPASPRITDRAGQTMLECVAADDQWRLPVKLSEISPHAVAATIATEDRRFYSHSGVDSWAVLRAAAQNLSAMRTVSGASTLTMQVCRMMDDRPRTPWAKAVESFRAVQLERLYSKQQILETYLNIAPYGGNIRGIEAAALAYFGKHARDLSLAEAAMLAGLPQSPGRYRPDRHGEAAARRRASVLAGMRQAGFISAAAAQAAMEEPLAARRAPIAVRASHAAWLALSQRPGGARTTIDLSLQSQLERLCFDHAAALPEGSDVAAVIVDIPTGEILALVGSLDSNRPRDGMVNGATAWRSPGSAVKPFVYAAAFESRRLAGDSIVYDVPIHRAGWSPANFDKTFSGPLSAADALRRSLNVPAILLAEGVGLGRCCGLMASAGLRLPPDAQSRGGLAVATGGVEVRLLDLTAAYATIGRQGKYLPLRLLADAPSPPPRQAVAPDVCLCIDDILSSRHRRPNGMENLVPSQVPWFMWKTGTSSARRDAVAVGHNSRYAAGVWVGRFSGQGDGAFVGGQAAEPLLARVFALGSLRVDQDPPAPPAWTVRFPLPPPAEAGADLKITYPHDGAVFLAMDSRAIVQPLVNRNDVAGRDYGIRGADETARAEATLSADGLNWFLNGTLVDPDRARRLLLPPGRYELRCADPQGNNSTVRFMVK